MSKRNVTVRYPQDTIHKVKFVAEKVGEDEAVIWRRLANSSITVTRLYREWQRIEREVSKIGSKPKQKLEERHDALMDRLGELSEAEQHLLDEIQAGLREQEREEEAAPA